jgi:hypothetical protein
VQIFVVFFNPRCILGQAVIFGHALQDIRCALGQDLIFGHAIVFATFGHVVMTALSHVAGITISTIFPHLQGFKFGAEATC